MKNPYHRIGHLKNTTLNLIIDWEIYKRVVGISVLMAHKAELCDNCFNDLHNCRIE